MGEKFLIIGHCKRLDYVPHWMHQATMHTLKMPCQSADMYEGHIFDIGQSRQRVTETFLSIPEATHLLFVDDDIVIPNPNALLGMFQWLEEKREYIISGLFSEKASNAKPCSSCGRPRNRPLILTLEEREGKFLFSFPYTDKPVPPNTLMKVGAVPGGFLLIKREVFEKIPPPWFVYGDPSLNAKRPHNSDKPIGNQPIGEDIYFSLKARKAGFKLWIDTRADLVHYVPAFVGSPNALKFVANTAGALEDNVQSMRAEYHELKKRESGT